MRIPTMTETPAAKAKRLSAPKLSPKMVFEAVTYKQIALPPNEMGLVDVITIKDRVASYRKPV